MYFLKLFAILFLINLSCQKETEDNKPTGEVFNDTPQTRPLSPGILDEASGIADSKANPGYLWVQQDGGNPNDIALLSHDGIFLKKINIKTAVNRDWEDMVLGNGPVAGATYIYLADIGDNSLASSQYLIYRFAEPLAAADSVFDFDKIIFQYPDGAHDAEAILVDNNTKDIYIITKQDQPSRVYKLAYPQNTGSINTADLSGSLPLSGVTGAAFSPDGKEILIKTYNSIQYWVRNSGQSVEQALAESPVGIGYQFEPQGEAICFKNDNSGFFTLSERPPVITAVNLNFYKRN